MSKHLLLLSALTVLPTLSAWCQEPTLTQKATLPTTLVTGKAIAGGETVTASTAVPTSNVFTLEVKGKVAKASGRGLDIEAANGQGTGYRLSLGTTSLQWSNPLTNTQTLTNSDNTQSQTLRLAADGKQVHIYQNGCYVASRDLSEVKVITDGKEGSAYTYGTTNLADGAIPTTWKTKPTPKSVGWDIVRDKAVLTDAWPNSRFEKNFSGLKSNDGTAYTGSFFFVRWDNNNYNHDYYTYPVTLEANTTYSLKMDYALWDNYSGSNQANVTFKGLQVGITQSQTAEDIYATKNLYCTTDKRVLQEGEFTFTTKEAGTYYLTVCGPWGMFAISRMNLVTVKAEPRIVVGNNEPESQTDITVENVSFDDTGAYAPTEASATHSTATYDNAGTTSVVALLNTDVTVSGKTDLHVTRDFQPLYKSTVNLQGDEAWLMLEGVKPSEVIANYLDKISVDGKAAVYDAAHPKASNVRIAIYGSGSVVIPNGETQDEQAITLYDGENMTGNSLTLATNTINNALGEWDNKVKSFRLRRGHMATLANNADGSGFSRVFIASDADIEVPVMPEGMESFVSYVRVFDWQWTSKKGKAGNAGDNQLNVTAFYNWNIDGNSTDPDVEYAAIRQNLWWPSFQTIVDKPNVTHLLGCNEPDRPDQSNATVDEVVRLWPDMMRTGYRLGSPAPSSVWTWVGGFMNTCDSLNYRVDFMAAHVYEAIGGSGIASRVKTLSDKGNGRPVWITEWNNGANWTTETWPTEKGTRVDVDGNPILDSNGNEQTVNRPLSPENAERQRAFMAEALPYMDNIELLEHYYEYDWVQDARALELNGKLTPAGKVYAAHKAAIGYNAKHEYVHTWKIAPPFPLLETETTLDTLRLSWYDHNGETGKKYILERKMDDEADFTAYKELVAGKDYSYGGTVTLREPIDCVSKVAYRIKALSYKDTESIYSREVSFTRDTEAVAPTLQGEAVSSEIISLTWNTVDNARSYRLERAEKEDGEYTVLADHMTETSYTDKGLKANTTYYYKVYALNTNAKRNASAVVAIATKPLVAPTAMEGVHAAAGNGRATLVWDFAHDAHYRISRAEKAEGPYTVIVDDTVTTRFVDKGLDNGTTYYYKVQPYNASGEGPTTDVMTATPQAGQYLHLAFDETEGTKAIDEWGAWDATLENNATWADGQNSGAVSISKAEKGYLQLPEGTVAELGNFTFATWMKAGSNKFRVFDFGSSTSTFMVLNLSATTIRYKITCPAGTFTMDTPYTVPTDTWMHLALTQDSDNVSLYVDGQLIAQKTMDKVVYPKDMGVTTSNYIGRSQWPNDPYCDHVYDDLRIYDTAMTSDAITALYEGKTPTAIEHATTAERTANAVYSLSGQKVRGNSSLKDLPKGVYIINSRKYVVK